MLEMMVRTVDLRMAAQYMVVNMEPKNTVENKILPGPVMCLMYALGPWRMPNDKTNKSEPISHKNANLVGFKASTGNMNTPNKKHRIEAPKHTPNPTILSNLLN